MRPLLTRGRWGIYSDEQSLWLCAQSLAGEHFCAGRFCHEMPAIDHGALRRVQPWYAPWQSARWCVQWALRELERVTAISTELGTIQQALADQQEIERILETL